MMKIDRRIDLIGMISSGLCAVHCMAIPALLALGIFESALSGHTHHVFELVVYICSIVLVSLAIYNGFRKHASWRPTYFMLIGLFSLSLGLFNHEYFGHTAMIVGGAFVAIGHLVNYQMLKTYHAH